MGLRNLNLISYAGWKITPCGFLANIATKLGNFFGERAERKLKEKYPHGLKGTVSNVFLTRGKRSGSFSNVTVQGYLSSEVMMKRFGDVYEVVYQAHLDGHEDEFILSLFEKHPDTNLANQLWLVGEEVTIIEYSCVAHPLHRFYLTWKSGRNVKSSVEVYPKKIIVHKEKFEDVAPLQGIEL